MGTESPSFIEPVTRRKDGIQVLLSKQRQKSHQPASSPATPKDYITKRKVEDSPTSSELLAESSGAVDINYMMSTGPSPIKKPRKLTGNDQPESVSLCL